VIEELLPASVAAVEATYDPPDAVLLPEEEPVVARAVESRRLQFTTARHCARRALAQLGLPAVAIPRGEHGEPEWPPGAVGAITHCEGYRAAAVARAREMTTIGIDAEPHGPLPDGILERIGFGAELAHLGTLAAAEPAVHWDRLLFSAKESVYKAWFPLARRWLGFEDAGIVFDSPSGTFEARLLVPGPDIAGNPLTGFAGRWLVRNGLAVTAIALPIAAP
jgi:4'-phosphopantetheinyl transferase EntD